MKIQNNGLNFNQELSLTQGYNPVLNNWPQEMKCSTKWYSEVNDNAMTGVISKDLRKMEFPDTLARPRGTLVFSSRASSKVLI